MEETITPPPTVKRKTTVATTTEITGVEDTTRGDTLLQKMTSKFIDSALKASIDWTKLSDTEVNKHTLKMCMLCKKDEFLVSSSDSDPSPWLDAADY